MYSAMDEIGIENTEKIQSMEDETAKWAFIYEVAKEYGFHGIHFTPSLYQQFGLDLRGIPIYFEDFKLSFHFGGLYRMLSEEDYETFEKNLWDGFEIAIKHKMHDISIHPPYVHGASPDERERCLSLFDKAMAQWAKKGKASNMTVSLETHVNGAFFLFRGLEEYILFADKHPDVGILIDISHNYFDNYSEDAIIELLGARNVKALHISDALQNVDFKKGTHLAIGEGSVDFKKLLKHFDRFPDMFGALEIKAANGKIQSSLNQVKEMLI